MYRESMNPIRDIECLGRRSAVRWAQEAACSPRG